MSIKTPAKAEEQKLEKVTLLKPHTHAGREYQEKDEIEVNIADKAWLIANKIIAGDKPAAN
ncbi:DUF7210 family protein [Pseudomonas paralcaligenes]|uniref:DUF7210 family protein n=1 Tax=Pseudomonas paralcaligenes TaxID=2772558 RepID=UPI001C8278D7|nr:hypothetical protein [Pseudomonas paralcaligenes]